VSPTYILDHRAGTANPAASSGPVGYTPAQIRHAYGFDRVPLNGAGQTIAIVDAYDDPAFVDSTVSNFSSSDLAHFDVAMGLPNPPSFTKYNEQGSTTGLPGTDPAGPGTNNWEVEEALDVEWAHAIAPDASIDLIECNSNSDTDLYTGVKTAAGLAGVSVVSMSWGASEYSGETSSDSVFTTPSGHAGVTFVASSGDSGTMSYPAASPNVLAVGGTTLTIGAGNSYVSETGWSGSGGGVSSYEHTPPYQYRLSSGGLSITFAWRTSPDVGYDADPNTGFAIYDSYSFGSATPWNEVGGTSAGAPQWAALIALADQGRAQEG